MPSPPQIPRDDLPKGIAKCLEVAGWRLREAGTLLGGNTPTTAAILFTFAVEEFGKAVLLHEAFESGQPIVEIAGFYQHQAKFEAAGRHIPERHLMLAASVFQPGVFHAGTFNIAILADLEARLDGLYVGWKGGAWAVGLQVNPDVLSESITAVGITVGKMRGAWVGP